MERRAPFLAGLINLIGARRLKPQGEDYLLPDNHGTHDLSSHLSLFNHSRGDTIAHPACGGKRECACKDLYDDLRKICEEKIHKHLPKLASGNYRKCSNLVYAIWNDQSDEEDLVYQLYLAPNVTGVSIPVFWSGFSWTLGTRQTMDEILRNASTEALVFHDIEHKDTSIGQALRARNWSRACHTSKHDSNLWVGLSRIYANSTRRILEKTKRRALSKGQGATVGGVVGGVYAMVGTTVVGSGVEAGVFGAATAAAALGSAVVWPAAIAVGFFGGLGALVGSGVVGDKIQKDEEAAIPSMVVLLINYYVDKLEKDSFLVKHELQNLHAFNNILVYDFKNHCSPSLVQMVVSHAQSQQKVWRASSTIFEKNLDEQSTPVVSCLSPSGVAVRRGKDQLSSIGDYEKVLPHIKNRVNRSRETLMLSVLNKTEEFVMSVDSLISRLESCYTHGVVWHTPAQPIDTSVVMENTHKDDITECQKRCGLIRDCSRFNFFVANQTCQLLSRNATLYYEATALNVTSGRPNCTEDAKRAEMQKQFLEELKTMKGSEAKAVTTIDVTSVVHTKAFERSQYRCCCDKHKRENDGINSTARANYCTLVRRSKCGNVKVRYDTKKAHHFESTGGKCDILRDDVPVLVKALKAIDYCPKNRYEFMNMTVDIPAAALGETREAPCIGETLGIVTCQVGTSKVGYWGAVHCSGEPAWCPTIPKIDDSAPEVAAAQLGDNHTVRCTPGEPSTQKTRCSEKGWIPEVGRTSFTEWNKYGLPPVCFQV